MPKFWTEEICTATPHYLRAKKPSFLKGIRSLAVALLRKEEGSDEELLQLMKHKPNAHNLIAAVQQVTTITRKNVPTSDQRHIELACLEPASAQALPSQISLLLPDCVEGLKGLPWWFCGIYEWHILPVSNLSLTY